MPTCFTSPHEETYEKICRYRTLEFHVQNITVGTYRFQQSVPVRLNLVHHERCACPVCLYLAYLRYVLAHVCPTCVCYARVRYALTYVCPTCVCVTPVRVTLCVTPVCLCDSFRRSSCGLLEDRRAGPEQDGGGHHANR